MEQIKFDSPMQQIVFQEYVDTVKKAQLRVAGLEEEMQKALSDWQLGPVVEALMALRGVKLITAMTVMAELGDISRFDSPRQLMAFLGLVPSEYSSGKIQRRGGKRPLVFSLNSLTRIIQTYSQNLFLSGT